MFIMITAIISVAGFAACETELVSHTLSYSAASGGKIIGTATQEIVDGDDGEAVTAVADDGYKFVKWSDGATEATRQDKSVTADISVTAEFAELEYYTLTYTASAGGRIEGETEQTVAEKTNGTTITAVADDGYKFVKWTDGLTEATRQDKSVSADISVTAEFAELEYYTLTYTASAGGHIEGETEQTIAEKTNGTAVKAVADYGYEFSKWSDGMTNEKRQELRVNDNKEIKAIFIPIPSFTLKYVTNNSGGHIEGETEQTILRRKHGKTVTAVAHDYYVFECWSDGLRTASRREAFVTEDKVITAKFRLVYGEHEYIATPEFGKIEGETKQRVYIYGGWSSEVTAVPNEGYVFNGWSDGILTPTRQDKGDLYLKVQAYFVKGNRIDYRVFNELGGHIEGEVTQYVYDGSKIYENTVTKPVKAVADDGYVFVGWSDGITEAERYESGVEKDFGTTAFFEPEEKTFFYDYRGATGNAVERTVTVLRSDPKASSFAVPKKDGFVFGGWYADEKLELRITDDEGELMYGFNTVTLVTDTLYARWIDPNDNPTVYKILLMIADEIDATARLRKDPKVYKHLHYKIPMLERILCKQIAGIMSGYLNEWFSGKVIFEVDTYFLTQPLSEANFAGDDVDDLYASRVPEVRNMLDKYNSILSLYDVNDDANDFIEPLVKGVCGHPKFASVYLQYLMSNFPTDKNYADKLARGEEGTERWWHIVETCLHEFTHTVEWQVYDYDPHYLFDKAVHDIVYNPDIHMDDYEIIRGYLLGELEIEGEIAGIPQSYWKGGLYRMKT